MTFADPSSVLKNLDRGAEYEPSGVIEPVCAWRWFEQHGTRVHITNPLHTRLIAESRPKHDMLDARMLAELLQR
jgi:hypothetical protein